MKIYVIGTSNSVMQNGWVFGLKHNKNIEVINLSVGRTPSLMHLSKVMIHLEELKEADLIIIDHIINDINFYIPKVGNEYYEYIKDLFILLSSIGKPIVNLIFPIFNIKNRNNNLFIIEQVITLCKEFNIYYINFNTLKLSLHYYEDDLHLKPEIAYFIGMELSRNLYQYDFRVDIFTKITHNPYRIFTYKNMISSMKENDLILNVGEFKNSLGTFNYIKLSDKIDLSMFNKYHLVALAYFNEEDKTHTFEISKQNESISYRTTDKKFFLEMISPPILIDEYSGIQKSKLKIKDIPSLMKRNDRIHKNIIGVNISYLLFKHSQEKFIWNISKDIFDLDLMALMGDLTESIDALFNKALSNEDIDIIRNSALLLEDINLEFALHLMKIGQRLRPKGIFITRKLEKYREKMKDKSN